MTDDPKREEGIRARGEEALSDLAQALLDNPIFGQAVSTAIGAGSGPLMPSVRPWGR